MIHFKNVKILFFSQTAISSISFISFRWADQVAINDEVLVQGYNKLTPTKVINVSSVIAKGE